MINHARLRAGILLTMAIATIYGGGICFAGAAHCIDEYFRYDIAAASPWWTHAKFLPMHVLSFIYPAIGMYASVMVLLIAWYHCAKPRLDQSPTSQANQECPTDQVAEPGR